MSNRKISIIFGPLAPKLVKQLKSVGVTVPELSVSYWQESADAISRLTVRGLITSSCARSARRKLVKKISKTVAESDTR